MSKCKLQTLVISYHNDSPSCLIQKMNLQGNVLISNQTNEDFSESKICKDGRIIQIMNVTSSGISNNRNTVLLFSSNDISILADDDMVFYDNYQSIVEKAYNDIADASVIIFNIDQSGRRNNDRIKRVNRFNYMRYGASRITYRTKSVKDNNINFHPNFGASVYGAGEDSIFLRDCLKKRMKIYTYPQSLSRLENDRNSTWFSGYDEKFFLDKGALLSELSPFMSYIIAVKFAITFRNKPSNYYGFRQTLALIFRGIKDYR